MRTRMRGKRAFLVLTGYVVTLSLIISLIYIVLHKNAPTTIVNQAGGNQFWYGPELSLVP